MTLLDVASFLPLDTSGPIDAPPTPVDNVRTRADARESAIRKALLVTEETMSDVIVHEGDRVLAVVQHRPDAPAVLTRLEPTARS